MKDFIKITMKTDQIDQINLDELKKVTEGESMINRIKYRRQVGNFVHGKKKEIAKGEILKQEHAHAEHLDIADKHLLFGFACLHYSVSEASGSIKIKILNKSKEACTVRVATIDAEAIAGEDYDAVDQVLEFKKGEEFQFIEVVIHDDENWEPDEDFFVQLYDPFTGLELGGKDTKTRVTIIDDDKPGQICFEETKTIKVLPSDEVAEIVILRKNGADGIVTVDYESI